MDTATTPLTASVDALPSAPEASSTLLEGLPEGQPTNGTGEDQPTAPEQPGDDPSPGESTANDIDDDLMKPVLPILNLVRQASATALATHVSTPAARHRFLKHTNVNIMPSYLNLISCDELSETDDRDTKLERGEKIVYFIRHGQSEANVASDEEVYMDKYRDAPLTPVGVEQARKLQEVNSRFNVQTIYTSPLTRAIQTTCHAFENSTAPIHAWPMITEFYPHLPECTGHNQDELAGDEKLTSLKRFSDVNLDAVHDNWWDMTGDRSGRLRSFFQWLTLCPERRIAVVCHWGFIYEALQVEGKIDHKLEIDNCTWVRTVWKTSALPLQTYNMPVSKSAFNLVMLPSSATSEAGTRYLADIADVMLIMQEHATLSNFSCLQYNRLPYVLLASFGPLADYGALRRVKDVIQATVQEETPSFTKYLNWHKTHRLVRKSSLTNLAEPSERSGGEYHAASTASQSPTVSRGHSPFSAEGSASSQTLRQRIDIYNEEDGAEHERRWRVGSSASSFSVCNSNVSIELPFHDTHLTNLVETLEETVEFEGAEHFELHKKAVTFLQHNEDFAEGRLWQPLGMLDFELLESRIRKYLPESNTFGKIIPIIRRVASAEEAAKESGSDPQEAARAAVSPEEWEEYSSFLHVMQNDINWELTLMSNRGNTHPYLYTEAIFSL